MKNLLKDILLALAVFLLLLTLSGCAVVPKTVEVPVAVACKVETPNEPTYRFIPPYSDIFLAVRDLLGDREVSAGYEAQLKAALESCK